jgi:Fic-DOC domain mobile mystery protein B
MGLDLDYIDGQTPLDEDEKDGLLIASITNRADLDEFEQQNIEEAILWTLMRSFRRELIFTDGFIRQVHKRMFGNVWVWAGEFRKSNKNLGVDCWKIPTELKYLLDDLKYWHENDTDTPDEIAIRFKHRLVSIHCFANGNGRHSRLMADIIIDKIYKLPVFSWGNLGFVNDGLLENASSRNTRIEYIMAIRAADNGDYRPLLAFARI